MDTAEIIPQFASAFMENQLPTDQRRRLANMRKGPIYLMTVQQSDDNRYEFEVCGTTTNIYTASLDTSATRTKNLIKCNCMDFNSRGRLGILCKHCCFVLLKCLRLPLHVLVEGTVKVEIAGAAARFLRNRGAQEQLVDEGLLEKYQALQNNEVDYRASPDGDSECMICIEGFEQTVAECCPRCKKLFHDLCIDQWFTVNQGNKTCPHCRFHWKGYTSSNSKSKNKKAKKIVNLNE